LASEITLYSYPTSPFAAKVHAYLLYKRLAFRVHYVNPLKLTSTLPVGQQIPVLTIDDNHYADSSSIINEIERRWPAEVTAQQPLIDTRDQWLTENMVPTLFRAAFMEADSSAFKACRNAWRLAAVMRKACGVPLMLTPGWPLLLRKQPFIRSLVLPQISQGSAPEQRQKMLKQMKHWLSEKPYLAGDCISQVDISAYGMLAMPYYLGLEDADDFVRCEVIKAWFEPIDKLICDSALQATDNSRPPLLAAQWCSRLPLTKA
jgi:glutathione S-transferase